MPQFIQLAVQNLLLANIALHELKTLEKTFDWVDLNLHEILSEPGQPMDFAYFPVEGICSVIASNSDGVRIEAGLIGREGFVGAPIILSVDLSPFKIIVRASGRALRAPRNALITAKTNCPSLSEVLSHYIHVFTIQVAQTALANGRFTIEQRLARWLLMCHDRTEVSEFAMTHEFMAVMLAVRRSGVTDALHVLEGNKLVQSTRGKIRIVNRAGLEDTAGGAYGIPEKEYERVIGALKRPLSPEP